MTYAGQEAQLSIVVFIFSKQPLLADVICWVRVSKFLATNTASLTLTFLSKSENEEKLKLARLNTMQKQRWLKDVISCTGYACVVGKKDFSCTF